jgi:hypothetical protein
LVPQKIILPALAAWSILLQGQAAGAGPGWIRVTTPDLDLLTTGEAALAAEAVRELETLRIFFRDTMPTFATTGARLRIVAFSSEGEFREFRVNAHSPAYFVSGPGQSTIVLGRLAKGSMMSLRHEYAHYLVRQSGLRLPLWLEEGLAEYYGGVSEERARSRSRLLGGGGWVPIGELLEADRQSGWYRQRALTERFYGASWALVDYLMTVGGGPEKGWGDIERWAAGDLGAVVELEAELRRHVRVLRGRGAPGGVAGAGAGFQSATAAVSEREAAVELARVQAQIGDVAGARARLEGIALEGPEAWMVAAEIERKQGRKQEARMAYREAMRQGMVDKQALWHLAVLEQSAEDGNAVPVLERLVETEPGFDEARLVLSSHYIRQQRYGEALSQLRSVRAAPPEQADYFQRALALAEQHAGSTLE